MMTRRRAARRLRPRRIARVSALLLVPAMQIVALLWLIWTRTTDLPIWDEWELAYFLERADRGLLSAADFWAFQNEHRIVLPRLILVGLIALTDWQRQIIMTINLAIGVAMAALFALAVRRAIGRRAFTLAAIPLSLLLLSFAQHENWLFAFQTNFILAGFGVACCTVGTTPTRTSRHLPPWGFPLAFAGALIASLSTLGGLLAWPAFLVAIWPRGRRAVALWCLGALAICIPYFSGFPRGSTTLGTPGALIGYGLAYLGAPLGFPSVPLAIGYGLLGLTLMVVTLVALWRRGGWSPRLLPWLALALFALAGAAITTAGRANLGLEQALASRYQIFSSFWWLALLVLGITLGRHLWDTAADRRHQQRLIGGAALIATLLLIGLAQANLRGYVAGYTWQGGQIARQECAARYDTAPDECLLTYYVSAPIARRHLAFFEQHGLSLFREREPRLATLPIGGAMLGAIDLIDGRPATDAPLVVASDTPVMLRGWASDGTARGRATAIYIVIDGRDTYRAIDGFDRPDVAQANGLTTGAKVGFEATLPPGILPPGEHTLGLRIVTADGRALADGARPLAITVR